MLSLVPKAFHTTPSTDTSSYRSQEQQGSLTDSSPLLLSFPLIYTIKEESKYIDA